MTTPTSQYRVRSLEFAGLQIQYDERVLTPRPWTAAQSRWAADLAADAAPGPLLEVCAGVGHIGLLAAQESGRDLVAVDIDPIAAQFLRHNAEAAGLSVEVLVGGMQDALEDDRRFGVIIADPPWVPADEVGRYPEDPPTAINGGPDGLALVGTCLEVIGRHLAEDGSAVLQVGPGDQADRAAEMVGPGLAVSEVRRLDRGSLLRIDRR